MTDPIVRHPGVYRGVVKFNNDVSKQGKLIVSVPQITGDENTDWIWPMVPSSIHTEVPAIGQGVWVFYQAGDGDYPVWFGEYGTNKAPNKRIYIKPLANTVSLTGLSPYFKTVTGSDGKVEVDLTATVVAMANTLKDYETRVASLEAQLVVLHNTLATRTTAGHTHISTG